MAGAVLGFQAGAEGGSRRCVWRRQWLKVVEVEGVGPIGGGRSVGRRGRRKRFWGQRSSPVQNELEVIHLMARISSKRS
jgi:hypothetical protein